MKSLTFSCLICALTLYFAQKLLTKTKKLLEVARTSESSSKVSEHNRDLRPNCAWGGSDSFVHVLEKGSNCYEKAFLKSQAFPDEVFYALVGCDSPHYS